MINLRHSNPEDFWVATESINEPSGMGYVMATLGAMLLAVILLLLIWGVPQSAYRVPDAPRSTPTTYGPPPVVRSIP